MQCMHRFYPAYAHKISWGEVIKSDTLISSAFITTPSLKPPSVPPASLQLPTQLPQTFPPAFPGLPFPPHHPAWLQDFQGGLKTSKSPTGCAQKLHSPCSLLSEVPSLPTPHVLGLGLGPMPDSRRALLPGLRPKPRRALQLQQRRPLISSLIFSLIFSLKFLQGKLIPTKIRHK